MNIYILVKKLIIVTRGNLVRQYQDRPAPKHRFLFDKKLMKF
jgi:hypothetical protein